MVRKFLCLSRVTVNKNGNVSVKAEEGEYQLLNEKETKALQKEILKTVTPKTGNVSVDKGKKTTVKLSSKLVWIMLQRLPIHLPINRQ